MPEVPSRSAPSRRGLTEYLLLVGFLVIAAAGGVALFGDELREAFGVPSAAAPPRAPLPDAPR